MSDTNDLSQKNQFAGSCPDCEAIAPLLDCYHDNEVDDAERLIVEKHLVSCPACTSELANIANLVERLRTLPPAHTEIDFADRIEQQILAAQGNTVVSISRSKRWLAPVAAAAAVIIAALVGMQMTNVGHQSVSVASSDLSSKIKPASVKVSEFDGVVDFNQKQNLVAISNPVQSNIAEELGITTDEDGLYAIKM